MLSYPREGIDRPPARRHTGRGGEKTRPATEAAGGRWTALDSLSRREHEVLNQLAKGLKNHVSEIYAKLGVHDRAQALRLALEAGIE